MSRNAISANPEHYIFKLFRGSMAPDPSRRPKKIFSRRCVAQNFFSGSTSPQTKILDRTLFSYCSWPPVQQKSRLLIGLNRVLFCFNNSSQITKKFGKFSVRSPLSWLIDNYAKDGGPGVICPSCSFYHDPLRY